MVAEPLNTQCSAATSTAWEAESTHTSSCAPSLTARASEGAAAAADQQKACACWRAVAGFSSHLPPSETRQAIRPARDHSARPSSCQVPDMHDMHVMLTGAFLASSSCGAWQHLRPHLLAGKAVAAAILVAIHYVAGEDDRRRLLR